MIVAHLTKSRFPATNILLLPLTYAVVDSAGPWLRASVSEKLGLDGMLGWPSALGDGVYQVALVFMCLGFGIGVYGSFVYDVIVTICDYLDIWCLTIKYPKSQMGSQEGQAEEKSVKRRVDGKKEL